MADIGDCSGGGESGTGSSVYAASWEGKGRAGASAGAAAVLAELVEEYDGRFEFEALGVLGKEWYIGAGVCAGRGGEFDRRVRCAGSRWICAIEREEDEDEREEEGRTCSVDEIERSWCE
jgi:hypothetical protein